MRNGKVSGSESVLFMDDNVSCPVESFQMCHIKSCFRVFSFITIYKNKSGHSGNGFFILYKVFQIKCVTRSDKLENIMSLRPQIIFPTSTLDLKLLDLHIRYVGTLTT